MNTPKPYTQVTIALWLTLCLLFPVRAATLHVVLIGDTDDERIGTSVKVDLTHLGNFVKAIADNTGLIPNLQVFQGPQLSTKENSYDKIKQTLQTLNVIPQQDVVLFYYSGHGGRNLNQDSKWPKLGVEGNTTPLHRMLELDWVIHTLQQKQPRLWIAIADACNSVGDILPSPAGRGQLESGDNYKKLFLNYQGHIIASSSKPGQYSYGSPVKGGLYTRAWLNSLNQELSTGTPDPRWELLMQRAEKPIPLFQPNSVQQPQSEVQVTPVSTVPPTPPTPRLTIGSCSQNQYGPDPKDPTKECCVDDLGNQVCAKK